MPAFKAAVLTAAKSGNKGKGTDKYNVAYQTMDYYPARTRKEVPTCAQGGSPANALRQVKEAGTKDRLACDPAGVTCLGQAHLQAQEVD